MGPAPEEKYGGTHSTVRTVRLDSFEARIGDFCNYVLAPGFFTADAQTLRSITYLSILKQLKAFGQQTGKVTRWKRV